MATRRLAAVSLRGASARATASAAPCLLHAPRTSFSAASQTLRSPISPARPRLLRSVVPGRAWYSDHPRSKVWNFEQIKASLSPSEKTTKPRVTLIDVREPDELNKTGWIPGALNVPIMSRPDSFHLSADEFRERYGFERPGGGGREKIVFYCKAGVRSRSAAQVALQAGWKNVGEYPGSWLDWVKNGGDVELSESMKKDKEMEEKEEEKGDGEGER